MSIDGHLEMWRRMERANWRDTVRINRPGAGAGSFDPNTGAITPPAGSVVYFGPGSIRAHRWEGADTQSGEMEVRFRGVKVKVPHDADVEKDDVVTVTASQHDSGLVGRVFRVTDVLRDGWQINRVMIAEEAT